MAEKYTLPELPLRLRGARTPTSPQRSWSCTTISTTQPMLQAQTQPLEQLEEARANGSYGNVSKLSKDLAFNLVVTQPLHLLEEPFP